MAIITEFYKTRADGIALYRTYSDEGRQVIREDGAVFNEAVDPLGSGHTYVEGEPLPDEEITAEGALAIIMGGADDETE